VNSIDNFSYITSMVLTPLFLVAGTFFPISGLPEWAQVAANFNPLYHCVQLVREACFGLSVDALWHYGALVLFGLVTWRLAINRMTRKLVT
jgi:lipooligosaccharide transport system permease protein